MAVNCATGKVIPFAFPALPHVRCLFTTRLAGNLSLMGSAAEREAAVAARRALCRDTGLGSWTELNQMHGDRLVLNPAPTDPAFTAPALAAPALTDGSREPLQDADGQATDARNHALCIKTADCQPVLLAHRTGPLAALHVGWRGNALRFIPTAVAAFCAAWNLDPADMFAVRGPSLGDAEFINFSREWPPDFAPWYDATRCRMDLWSLTRSQLMESGIPEGHIYGLDLCTLSLPYLFFSHRRKDSGRMMALIWRA